MLPVAAIQKTEPVSYLVENPETPLKMTAFSEEAVATSGTVTCIEAACKMSDCSRLKMNVTGLICQAGNLRSSEIMVSCHNNHQ